ncbi:hypothetical protein PR048_023437 [Dryococelus australis]|uniref:Lipid-binding serum glycoprotein N-terminal domain-containing protein n=1 Tax=Dryococelus australis TaxID=614101 RepID=A0ABQ9GU51_9NEOP|nr:hypothetical protein PR048_023437 [Dryococelus australis]
MCKLWVSLAILLAGTSGDSVTRLTQHFLNTERHVENENAQLPYQVSFISNVTAQVGPYDKASITNSRVTSDVPQILIVDRNSEHLNLEVVVSLGTVVVDGDVSLSSSSTSLGFAGEVVVTYVNMSGSGVAGVRVVEDALQVTYLQLTYSPQERSTRATSSSEPDRDAEEVAMSFFERSVKEMVTVELDRRVKWQLGKELRYVNAQEMFGTDVTMQQIRGLNITTNISPLVDNLLKLMIPRLPSSLRLDDINKYFKRKVLIVPISAQLKATNGVLKDLKTLQRTSDVFLNVMSTGMRVWGAMGLKTLQFAYDFVLRDLGVTQSGQLKGQVSVNSISFALNVTIDGRGNCVARIEQLHVEQLNDIKIKVSGLGILNWLASWLITAAVNTAKIRLTAPLEARLAETMVSTANQAKLCSVLNLQ